MMLLKLKCFTGDFTEVLVRSWYIQTYICSLGHERTHLVLGHVLISSCIFLSWPLLLLQAKEVNYSRMTHSN